MTALTMVEPNLARAFFALEPTLWDLSKDHPEYRELALTLAMWWTPKRALVVLRDRCGHSCELCGKRFSGSADTHHVFHRSEYRGPFQHHPGNLLLVHRECHDRIHAGMNLDRAMKERAMGRLPEWSQDVDITETRAAIKHRKNKRNNRPLCPKCGEPIKPRDSEMFGFYKRCWSGQVPQ